MSGSTPNRSLGSVGRQPRLSDRVADDIARAIVAQQLQPGDALPPERELGNQFGVSRTVIREAVRALDARGLVDVRVGSRIKVAAVDPGTVHDAIWHFARRSPIDDASIAAVGDALVAAAARLAAEHANDGDLELIDRAATSLENGATEEAGAAFRRAVVAASRNEFLIVLVDAVDALNANGPATDPGAAPRAASPGTASHRAVAAAIARRDPDAAERAMRERLRTPLAPDTTRG